MARILATVAGCIPGEELVIEQRCDRTIEFIRLRPRGGRVAALTLDPDEVEELILALETVKAELDADRRGAANGVRSEGPPIVDLRELGLRA